MTRRKSKTPASAPDLTPAEARQPVTRRVFHTAMAGVGELVRAAIERRTDPLGARVAELEAAVAELAAAHAELDARSMTYCGVFQRAQRYSRGDAVTAANGLWVAIRSVQEGEEPGSSSGWQLCLRGAAR